MSISKCLLCDSDVCIATAPLCVPCDLAEAVEFAEGREETAVREQGFDLRALVAARAATLPVIAVSRPRSPMQDNAFRRNGSGIVPRNIPSMVEDYADEEPTIRFRNPELRALIALHGAKVGT